MTASGGDCGRVPEAALADLAADIFIAAGASAENARIAGQALAEADAAGRVSHGMRQVAAYVDKLLAGEIDGTARPAIAKDSGALVRIDGRRTFGQVVGGGGGGGVWPRRPGSSGRASTGSARSPSAMPAISGGTHAGRKSRRDRE